ncbi:TatD family deoxyribonuclease [Arthrobacter sp. NamB2]|uniref:TatD family hydrolase n=1 Tax=Arthrobacter sp. NamB2 TaxID=2576035 RepID=UPI0010CA0DF0|nr:TatD family hydrolase [Arthrobacter sp. NamB2]TKV28335.1 TatD family deoxyribonuclease [Arthrobacter sp. NamB2]
MCNSAASVRHPYTPGETPPAYREPEDAGASPGGTGEAGGASDDGDAAAARRRRKGGYPPLPEPLPLPVIDNHTHFDFRDGSVEVSIGEALDAAGAAGVRGAVQVGTDLESSRFTAAVVEQDARLLGAVALHPNEAPLLAGAGTLDDALSEIELLASGERVRALGETGLDYFRTGEEGRGSQLSSFRSHIDIAKRLGKALQIHDRDAHDDVVKTLLADGAPDRVVLHCFSSGADLARTCNEQGWYMSFAGTVTFKNAENLREALLVADPALVLTETDAPFLTPHPHRGHPNASYAVPYTVRAMAGILDTALDALCARLTTNTEAVYGSWD